MESLSDRVDQILATNEISYIYAYPPKRVYQSLDNPSRFVQGAWEINDRQRLGVYLHTPFCLPRQTPKDISIQLRKHGIKKDLNLAKCGFCNLFAYPVTEVPDTYSQSLIKELTLYKDIFRNNEVKVSSIYFGGGTPALMAPERLHQVLQCIQTNIGEIEEETEVTVETSPESVDDTRLNELRAAGFNRISFGIQSFNSAVLQYLGRNYDPLLGLRALEGSLKTGFFNINADLIIGLPKQTRDIFLKDLNCLVGLGIPTITLYQFFARPLTRFGVEEQLGILEVLGNTEMHTRYTQAKEILTQEGYTQQSLNCWSRLEHGYKQQDDQFDGVPLLGIGVSARSYAPLGHYSTDYATNCLLVREITVKYQEEVEEGRFPASHGFLLNQEEAERHRLIFGLVSRRGIDVASYSPVYKEIFAVLHSKGLLENIDGRLRWTLNAVEQWGPLSRLFYSPAVLEKEEKYSHK